MKMIIAILNDEYRDSITSSLIGKGFKVTHIATTGGLFRQKSSTLMIGVQNEDVESAIEAIKHCCVPSLDPTDIKATLFVLDIAKFEQI